jgi:hypothetical protein
MTSAVALICFGSASRTHSIPSWCAISAWKASAHRSGTVFSYLPVKVGETMTDEKAAAAIKALFATGFFKDVRLEVQRDVLIVMVEERPAVSQIDFIGNKEFDKDALKKGLRDIGLAEGRSLDKALLDQAEQEIKRQYLARGRYGASVVTTVTPLERNRVGCLELLGCIISTTAISNSISIRLRCPSPRTRRTSTSRSM